MAKNTNKNNDSFEDDDFVTVEDSFPEPWKDMEEGDSISGKYLGQSDINGTNDKPFTIYKLKNSDGELISVSGASLEARMATIPVGTKIKVIYKGTAKSKFNTPMKMFEVQVPKRTKLIEV